jgi:hypothetical protein
MATKIVYEPQLVLSGWFNRDLAGTYRQSR